MQNFENVFGNGGCIVYENNSWQVINTRKFSAAEQSAIRSTTVVKSQFGKSVCFFLKSGGMSYIPLSNRGKDVAIGASINLEEANLVHLHRDGDGDIVRVEL